VVTVIAEDLPQKTIPARISTINNILSVFAVDITVNSSQHLRVHLSHFRVQGLMTTDIASGGIGIV
jgi:hypothetical protein